MSEKRKPGRPKKKQELSVEDMIDEDGNPLSMERNSKDAVARRFRDSVERKDKNHQQGAGRGMYSGMANPESYLEFYKMSTQKPRKGRPWTYPTAEALQNEITSYFEFCIDERIPVTVAGLSAWLGISTTTLKNWQRQQDKYPFYEVVEPAIAFIHAMTEQGAVDGTVPAVPFIFLAKNYHYMKDNVDYIITPKGISSAEQDEIINNLPIDEDDNSL